MPSSEPTFYFSAMSPYSWLAAERIDRILPQAAWRPVAAAVIFETNGRTSWGLTADRDRGMRDCEARAARRGLGRIRWPESWPTNGLPVAIAMAFAQKRGMLRGFALSAMRLGFLEGRDLADTAVILEAGERAGLMSSELEIAIQSDEIDRALHDVTAEAIARGVFGVPTVVVGGEVFWGDDHLEDAAVAHARVANRRGRPASGAPGPPVGP
jgi:2-hydroxychromene-2-carboxylate isomerase